MGNNFSLGVALVIFCFCIGKGSSELESRYTCVGEELFVSCTTNGSTIQWDLFSPDSTSADVMGVYFSESGMTNLSEAVLGNTKFHFFKSSNSPFASTVMVDNVTIDVDGVRVDCRHQNGTESTLIHIIEDVPNVLVMVASEEYSADIVNVTVNFESNEEPYVKYNVTVLDLNATTSSDYNNMWLQIKSSSITLELSYNTVYRVSFKAYRCGQSSMNMSTLHYVKCGDPSKLLSSDDSIVTNYSEPALVGSNVTITCPSRDEEAGNETQSFVLTCMSDGEWSSDSQLIGCDSVTPVHTPSGKTNVTDSSIPTGVSVGIAIVVVAFAIVLVSLLGGFVITFRHLANKSDSPTCVSLRSHRQNVEEVVIGSNQSSSPEHHYTETNNSGTNQKQICILETGIVYADVGSLSLQLQPHVVNMVVDDNCKVEYAQIKIQPLNNDSKESKDLKENSDNPNAADDSLNLDSLLIQLKPEATSKWYHFGQALGVDNKILDACLPYPPEQNIIEVCDNWIRNHTGKPAWWEVAEALKRIGIQRLALDIEKVYETGNLPKAVEMNANLKEILLADEGSVESPPALPPRLY